MNLKKLLEKGFVFVDGGFGTMLQERGIKPGELPEMYNLTRPDTVRDIYSEYIAAGADIITANTFGANSLKYGDNSKYSLEEVVSEGINLAKSAARASGRGDEISVALDIGPTGKLLKPLGDLDFEEATDIFSKTVKAGVKSGADIIIIETMNDTAELKAAVLAAKENSDLPIIATVVFDENAKLMTGANPEAITALLEGLRVDALGINCSLGPDKMLEIVEALVKTSSLPVCVSPNAGLPRVVDGKTVFDVDPDEFAESMKKIASAGARILGGCCGTTPAHIKAMKKAVQEVQPLPVTEKEITLVSSYTHAVIIGKKPLLIGERLNPTGKSKLKAALREKNMSYILDEAVTQQELGAHILDINVGLPEIDEPEMMKLCVSEVQGVSDLPLQIDTSDITAMEAGLRRCNGKPLINSVNGKQESMEQIFPLAAKYGGVVVGLTLDENGIPGTAEGRLKIAEKIYKKAAEYGIKRKDIIIDPLAMAVSSDGNSARITLETLSRIAADFNGHTILGVSNISFGLPQRDYVTSVFFAQALSAGLSAAIMNPCSFEMMKTYKAFCALNNYDARCLDYIDFAVKNAPVPAPASASAVSLQQSSAQIQIQENTADTNPLYEAIIKGLKKKSADEAAKMLAEGNAPLDIINGTVIPALNEVGTAFESKKMFLPQLLMSADSSKEAFEVIKTYIKNNTSASGASDASEGSSPKRTVVIATVKGDIHDIGKNIVKVLLENYGFDVIDLGRDVDPEEVLDAARKSGAKLVGLSALMTTTVPAMHETIKLLHSELPDCKVVVGGAVLTQEYADMISADKYAKDAMETVRYAETVLCSDT